jgi:hypothetical protein
LIDDALNLLTSRPPHLGESLMTRETVRFDTPDNRAMSLIVDSRSFE